MKPPVAPPSTVRTALKEWAAVAAAIRAGRQSLLLRAGGIADPAGRFGFADPWFWIYPTRFHESADRLLPEAKPFVDVAAAAASADAAAAADGRTIRSLDLLASLEAVTWIDDRTLAERLAPMHVLAPAVVRERFDYRQPGLAVALVRVWRRRGPHRIEETPAMEGCRSWVKLAEPLECDALEPVLSDTAFEAERQLYARLTGPLHERKEGMSRVPHLDRQ